MTTREDMVRIIREEAEGLALEIVSLQVQPNGRVRCMIDREPDGVTIDDCTALTRALHRALEDHEIDPGDHDLEVMSPGLNRPLLRDKDFTRFAGREVTLALEKKTDGRRNFRGVLLGRDDRSIRLELPAPEGERSFPRDAVKEVRLVPDLMV